MKFGDLKHAANHGLKVGWFVGIASIVPMAVMYWVGIEFSNFFAMLALASTLTLMAGPFSFWLGHRRGSEPEKNRP